MAAARKRLRWVALVFIVAGVAFAILYPESAARAAALPLLAVFSLARMVAAYLLALVFAIAYGTTMALSKRAALVMLPLLDILQSVPILGFFPAALVFFVATFQGHPARVVVTLDALIWRHLSVWSERFRIETTCTGQPVPRVPGVYERLAWLPRFTRLRAGLGAGVRPIVESYGHLAVRLDRVTSAHRGIMRAIRWLDLGMFIAIFAVVVTTGLARLTRMLLRPFPPTAYEIPEATLRSLIRLALAYAVSLAWTIPAAVYIGRNARSSRFLTPAIEVFASIPATAPLPLILGLAIALTPSLPASAAPAPLLIAPSTT